MKEESEKVGLKLNIQKRKIMASGPITSWEIDGNNNPVYETAKETLMYRSVLRTLWERERGRFGRMALKHV